MGHGFPDWEELRVRQMSWKSMHEKGSWKQKNANLKLLVGFILQPVCVTPALVHKHFNISTSQDLCHRWPNACFICSKVKFWLADVCMVQYLRTVLWQNTKSVSELVSEG